MTYKKLANLEDKLIKFVNRVVDEKERATDAELEALAAIAQTLVNAPFLMSNTEN